VNDANDLAVVSIDLQRFDKRLSNKLGGVRIRKEAFVDLEVYCHDPNDQPIPKIHFAEPPSAVEPAETGASSGDDFDRTEEDFPEMGVEYGGIYLKAENELRRLRNHVDLTSEDLKTIQDLLEEMDDPLVSITSMTIDYVLYWISDYTFYPVTHGQRNSNNPGGGGKSAHWCSLGRGQQSSKVTNKTLAKVELTVVRKVTSLY
jgi:hypothetical protein